MNKYILLLYTNKTIKEYNCLYEFFLLCGYVVDEKKVDFEIKDIDLENYDCILNLSDINIVIEDVILENLLVNMIDKSEDILQLSIQLMLKRHIINEKQYDVLKKIKEIYINNSLNIHGYNFKNYFYNVKIMEQVLLSYKKAEEQLFELRKKYINEEKSEEALMSQYSRCLCATRIVEIEKKLEKENEIISKNLVINAIQNMKNKEHYTVLSSYLLGKLDSTDNYIFCIRNCKLKKGSFVSELFYYLAKIIEDDLGLDKAMPYYEKSLVCNNDNYKSEYKYLFCLEQTDKKSVYFVLENLKNIIIRFNELLNLGYIQPLEIEALINAHFRCARIYLRIIGDYQKAIEHLEKIEELSKLTISQFNFIKDFYGDNADYYLQTTLNRINIKQLEANKSAAKFDLSIKKSKK